MGWQYDDIEEKFSGHCEMCLRYFDIIYGHQKKCFNEIKKLGYKRVDVNGQTRLLCEECHKGRHSIGIRRLTGEV